MFELVDFTPQLLVAIVGIVLSLLFNYFPLLNTWYADLKTEFKSLIMILLLLLSAVGVYLLTYFGLVETTEPLSIWLAVKIFISALIVNQATYVISPERKKVVEIIEDRDIEEKVERDLGNS